MVMNDIDMDIVSFVSTEPYLTSDFTIIDRNFSIHPNEVETVCHSNLRVDLEL